MIATSANAWTCDRCSATVADVPVAATPDGWTTGFGLEVDASGIHYAQLCQACSALPFSTVVVTAPAM